MNQLTEALAWIDTKPRSGTANMAIDQALLESTPHLPTIRFYQWEKPTISFGYFESLSRAKSLFPDQKLTFIRRWTGGGIVDHRIDLTYTITIPRIHPWSQLRGAESYRIIHSAVAAALNSNGTPCQLTPINSNNQSPACFANPVAHDIISPSGQKLAGAGQKRSRHGLLHQGSVINIKDPSTWQQAFINAITLSTKQWEPDSKLHDTAKDLEKARYSAPEWALKRP